MIVTEDMVKGMKPGSVIVDMAVEQGGNCPLSKMETCVTTANGVKIIGYANLPSRIAVDASALYAKNLLNFITPLIEKGGGAMKIDTSDEIVAGTLVTKDGAVVHSQLLAQLKQGA